MAGLLVPSTCTSVTADRPSAYSASGDHGRPPLTRTAPGGRLPDAPAAGLLHRGLHAGRLAPTGVTLASRLTCALHKQTDHDHENGTPSIAVGDRPQPRPQGQRLSREATT